MATLTVQTVSKAGLTPALVSAAGGGDEFANNGKTFVHIKNGSGGSITVTLVTQATVDGLAVADRTVVIPAGQERMIGELDPQIYNTTNGRVQLTYSGVTSLTVGAFRLP